jgi:ankyrin repeat protein
LLVPGVNVRDGDSMTALHHAALTGDEELVAWLLASGADPTLELTQVFDLNAFEVDDPWNTKKETYPVGMRAYDIAKKEHDHTRWNTGKHRAVVDMLDKVTPRRGWFKR